MLATITEMYQEFLDGITKEESAIVPPEDFIRLINRSQSQWLVSKAPEGDTGQKRIDDLEIIRVVTDGVFEYNSVPLDLLSPVVVNQFELVPSGYPSYFRLLNVMFQITYSGNSCFVDGVNSELLDASIMRADKRSSTFKNPMRWPTDERLYYEIIGNRIRLITGTSSIGYRARLEYYRYPLDMVYDEDDSNNNVNCEFGSAQQYEICDIAIRIYLERKTDPRYQTILNEEAMKASSQ